MIRSFLAALAWLALVGTAPAQPDTLTALARLDPTQSSIQDTRRGVQITLMLSQPVPYRVHTLDDPRRLVLDFRQVDFARLEPAELGKSAQVTGLRHGMFQPGWSRLVLDLAAPLSVDTAGMTTGLRGGGARIDVELREVTADAFAQRAGASVSRAFPDPVLPPAAPKAEGRVRVVLDPGHGGIDPGAVRDGVHEADLMLTFARQLRETLRRTGAFDVVLTREEDVFVSLEARIAIAKRADADVFLSLHADAIAEGIARGAQVYTLADEASSAASAQLAERHNRGELLAGVDLTGQDDRVATVLMALARTETQPRTEALAQALIDGLRRAGVRMHRREWERARFSVLKAPDIPSALLEVGFMSSPGELEKLQSEEWRQMAARGITEALTAWVAAEAARSQLLRQ